MQTLRKLPMTSPNAVTMTIAGSGAITGASPALSAMPSRAASSRLLGGGQRIERRIRRERLGVAFAYLAALREDFQSLLRIARVIAVLSPEVAAAHEFERLRLTTNFAWRYQMTRWKLLLGFTPLPQLDGLSELVSGLSVRMEAAIKDLGERAALAAEMASSINRRGVDLV